MLLGRVMTWPKFKSKGHNQDSNLGLPSPEPKLF